MGGQECKRPAQCPDNSSQAPFSATLNSAGDAMVMKLWRASLVFDVVHYISFRLPASQNPHLSILMAWYYSTADLLATVSAQVHEMELVRRKIYDLEAAQNQIKAKYAPLHTIDQITTLTIHQIRRGDYASTPSARGPRWSKPASPYGRTWTERTITPTSFRRSRS